MLNLPKTYPVYIPELLEIVNKQKDDYNQKVLFDKYFTLDEMHGMALKHFVELMLHPDIEWDLPEGSPPYQPASGHIDQAPNNLFRVFKELSYFLKGGYGFIVDNQKRETHFVVTLESLSAQEASLLCQIKEKKLTSYPNVNLKNLVELYGEDWLPEGFAESFLEQPNSKSQSTSPPLKESQTTSKGRGRPPKSITK